MKFDAQTWLRNHGIQPSAQRVAVTEYVMQTASHPSADQVWTGVRERFPMVSRATVYNTLNLLVEKGLLCQRVLAEGRIVFDPNTVPHHHFIDDDTGHIYDVPWEAIQVSSVDKLEGMHVREFQVVMRGTKAAES